MKYGYVRVCAATPEMRVADVEFNSRNIINAINAIFHVLKYVFLIFHVFH